MFNFADILLHDAGGDESLKYNDDLYVLSATCFTKIFLHKRAHCTSLYKRLMEGGGCNCKLHYNVHFDDYAFNIIQYNTLSAVENFKFALEMLMPSVISKDRYAIFGLSGHIVI